jgi:lysophospholipase L1-like esterase
LARAFILISLLLFPVVASATSLTIAGFGDSITCTPCNDGSYLADSNLPGSAAPVGVLAPSEINDSLLEDELRFLGILQPADVLTIDDNAVSANLSSQVSGRLDTWITGGGAADFVIVMSGTPDAYQAVGGFNNQAYSETETVGNISDMLDAIFDAGMQAILMAPPPVWTPTPCGGPDNLTCADIDASLASLMTALDDLATTLDVPFVNLYDAFANHPDIGNSPGDSDSLYRTDGLHPRDNGDELIAFEVAAVIAAIPEPSTGLLVASGLLVIAVRRRQLRA